MCARHEILATGCIYAPAKASILFDPVAYFAALRLFLDELVFVAVCAFERELDVAWCVAECFGSAWIAVFCVREDSRVWEERRRERPCGASRTGSATARYFPAGRTFERRWFHRRSDSTVTPKRSATVTSVSPRRVL